MDNKREIERLTAKYLDGLTTNAEERRLAKLLATSNILTGEGRAVKALLEASGAMSQASSHLLPLGEAPHRGAAPALPSEDKSLRSSAAPAEGVSPHRGGRKGGLGRLRGLPLSLPLSLAVAAMLAGAFFLLRTPQETATPSASPAASPEAPSARNTLSTPNTPSLPKTPTPQNTPSLPTSPSPSKTAPLPPHPALLAAEAEVREAERAVEQLVAAAEQEAETRIEVGGREILIENTEAYYADYLASIEDRLAEDIEETDREAYRQHLASVGL